MMSTPLAPGFIPALRRSKADLFHFHFPHPTGEVAYLLSGLSTPAVATYHSDVVRQRAALQLYRPFMNVFLKRMRVIMPTTRRYMETSEVLQPLANRCRPVALGLPAEDYEPTDQTRAMSKEFRQRWGDFIFFIGVLRYYKGLRYLLQALHDVPGTQVVIAGDGPERAPLEALAGQLGLLNRIHFLGRVDQTTAIALLHAASVFCLPACERAEAFGLCQIEAMLASLPIVSTNLPTGVPEINRHGETGLIVEPKQPAELAGALRQLLADPSLRERMGAAGRERALAEFTAERMAEQVQDVYSEVLDNRHE
jgi:rhamnosyl/mannosyltransferase